jgi:hypothetical protein
MIYFANINRYALIKARPLCPACAGAWCYGANAFRISSRTKGHHSHWQGRAFNQLLQFGVFNIIRSQCTYT